MNRLLNLYWINTSIPPCTVFHVARTTSFSPHLPTYPVCFQMLPIHEQGYLGSCDFVTHFSKNASKHSVQKQDLIYATFHFGNLLFTLPNKCVDYVEGRHEQRQVQVTINQRTLYYDARQAVAVHTLRTVFNSNHVHLKLKSLH